MLRIIATSLVLVGLVLGGIVALALDHSATAELELQGREVDGTWVEAGLTRAQALAFRSHQEYGGIPPVVVHPPDGAVYPATFPPPRIQWTDEYASRIYYVTVLRGEALLFSGVTRRRELRPTPEAWAAVRASSSSSPGPVTVRIASGLVEPDGVVLGELSVSDDASFTVAPEAESPTGMILFGAKHRPAAAGPGTVPLLMMHLRIDGFDVVRQEHRVLFRSSYGPEPTRAHPGRREEMGGRDHEREGADGPDGRGGPDDRRGPDERRGPDDRGGPGSGDGFHGGGPDGEDDITSTQCVSCHAMSHDGKYIAVFSQTAEESPPDFDAPNGFLTVLAMPARELVIQLPHAFMPQFHPTDSTLLAFGEVDETIGTKDQMMVRHSDIHVLDLKTRQHAALPGAAEPDRVENFPFWSPDGSRIAYIRTKKGEMWHGSAGLIDIAVVPYDDGRGGVAVPLVGASENGKSNFLPVYSRDGRWIIFTQADEGFFSQESSDLWIVPAEGGQPRALGLNSAHTESWHRFSPDGRWLAVVTNREDIRRPHIYVSRFDSAAGTAAPAIQLPFVAGAGAHTHAFSWTATFPWLDEYELANE